jgi:hypothetical protein
MEKNAKVSIQYDAFVKAVRPDSKATESTVFLEGFIGESSLADHFRLYSDASLNDFVEIPTDAVVHSIANSKEESALGGSKLWVKKDAIFTYGNPAMDNRPQASFLDGDLYQGYMDNMYQPNAGGNDMGMMGGISQPITGCVAVPTTTINTITTIQQVTKSIICKKSLLTPCITKPWSPICNIKTTPIVCLINTINGCFKTINGCFKTIGGCQSIACNPGDIGGGRPFDANQGMADQFGGSFNPYFDGDLYQGYMDNMYQPQADASGVDAGQGDFMQQTINPVICGGTVGQISLNPAICGIKTINPPCLPKKSFVFPCPTNIHFPPCNFHRTTPWGQICTIPSTPQFCITKPIVCKITGGNGPIVSIADCPSFPCPTPTFKTEIINPNPNVGGGMGGMNDQFGGNFNPYFDGDLNKAYMENMYQPQADAGAGMGNMGGAATIATNCGIGAASIACSPVSRLVVCNPVSQVVVCNPISRIVICFTRSPFNCITRDGRISVCNACPPWTWNKTTTIWGGTGPIGTGGPVFNPGNGGGGFGQMGGDFNGSFDPYSGY